MGFQIFSSALRRFAPADGRPLHLCSEPGPRVRCRRSLVRCPIDFRRADPPAPARVSSNGERKRASLADRGCRLRWTSGLACFPSAVRFRRRRVRSLMSHAFSERHGSFLPWAFPLSGLSGTFDVHRSRLEPRSIISLREAGACSFACAARRGILRARRDRVSLAIRSWALGDPSRDMTHRRAAVEEMCAAPPCAPA